MLFTCIMIMPGVMESLVKQPGYDVTYFEQDEALRLFNLIFAAAHVLKLILLEIVFQSEKAKRRRCC